MAEHLTRNEKVVGSIPTISSKMNDPTQFEQVDETCGSRKRINRVIRTQMSHLAVAQQLSSIWHGVRFFNVR